MKSTTSRKAWRAAVSRRSTARAATVSRRASSPSVFSICAAMARAAWPPSRAVLRPTGLLDEAHAAVHLHAQRSDVQAHLGGEALHQRHQEFVEGLVLLAHL